MTPKMTESNKTPSIRFATMNVLSGRREKLHQVMKCFNRHHTDVAFMQETRIPDKKHPRSIKGHKILCSPAPSASEGGVAIAFRSSSNWHIESPQAFRLAVIRAALVHGSK